MQVLTVVVPDLIRLSKKVCFENSLCQQLENVRKGSLPSAIAQEQVKTMVDGIDYCAAVIQVPNNTRISCELQFNECEKVPLKADPLTSIFGEDDTTVTLGKNKENDTYFFMVDRKPESILSTENILKLAESLIRLTTDLKLRELEEIGKIRLPFQLTGSFVMSVKCGEDCKRTINIFDENLTLVGFIDDLYWHETIV